MEHFSNEHGLTCEAIMWVGEGPQLVPQDEQHAFRYEVRDERGTTIGFINTDRARQHPDVKWERSFLRDGKIEELDGNYQTVREALAAFRGYGGRAIYFTINAPHRSLTTIFDADGLERARSFKQALIRGGAYLADQISISSTDSSGKLVKE